MRDGGKGDRQRPLGIDEKTFSDNWDQIFKRRKERNEVSNGVSERCPNHDNCVPDDEYGDL